MDERIEERMEEITEYFDNIEEIRDTSEALARKEAEENLVRKIVSATIDIASRIIALESSGRPESYAEYFEVLVEKQVLTEELGSKLKEMARFRNLIVHQYHKISQEELDEIIENDLQDIEKFLEAVEKYYES